MGLGISPTTIGLLCLANLAELLFSLALLVDWFRCWRYVKAYWACGLAAGLGLLGFGALQVLGGALAALSAWNQYLPPGWEPSAAPSSASPVALLIVVLLLIAAGLVAILVSVTRLAGFTMLGVHYAAVLGHPGFRLLQRLGRAWPPAAGPLEPAAPEPGTVLPTADSAVSALPAKPRPWRDYALSTLGVAVAAVAYSVLLFRATSPHVSDVFTRLPGYAPEMSRTVTPLVLVVALAAAFSEELTYRLGIQGFLARYLNAQGSKYWLPVVLTALLWTLQHAGTIEPGWVKLAQIFPIGLMLGWLYRRHGVESCILAHALFNLGLVPFVSSLIGT